jgi:hypothetical protein
VQSTTVVSQPTANAQPPTIQSLPPTAAAPGFYLLPRSPYFNSLRAERRRDPARFDSYFPRVGAFFGLEVSGLPTAPVALLHRNRRFNAPALRARYAHDPSRFKGRSPILGALFQLESGGEAVAATQLLPASLRFNAMRAHYARDPIQFSRVLPYYGAVIKLEDIEIRSRSTVAVRTAPAELP